MGNGEGTALSPVAQVRRTPMEAGQDRVRRITTTRRDVMRIRWRFDPAEMAIFRAWHRDSVSGPGLGAEWFSMVVSVGGGFTTRDVRFAGPFRAQRIRGGNWDVSATLEVQADG